MRTVSPSVLLALLIAVVPLTSVNAEPVSLGSYLFDSLFFGDTVIQTPGNSTIAAPQRNWLNIVNADPGVPGALLGPNFNTGLLSRGFQEANPEFFPVRTIGYTTPVVNQPGVDFGVVTAQLVGLQPVAVNLAVSLNGVDFIVKDGVSTGPWGNSNLFAGNPNNVSGPLVDTGVDRVYYNGDFTLTGNNGPLTYRLYVTPIDLSSFGLAEGATVEAVRVGASDPSLDLVRIAAFGVPEPAFLRRLMPRKHLFGRELNAALNPRLQRLTALGATAMLRALQIPASQRGVKIDLPTVSLEVQEWCSGLTFMKWLVLLALLIAIVSPRTLPWRIALVLIAPAIAFEANVLRVAGVGLSLEWLGRSYKDWMGAGMMIVGVVQMMTIGRLINRTR